MFDATDNVAEFSRALGNGPEALSRMYDAFLHVVTTGNGDATPIARLIDRAIDKKDDAAGRAVAFFVKNVWVGAKVTVTKGKPTTIKTKGSEFNAAAMTVIGHAVANEVSLRSTNLKALFTPKKAAAAAVAEEVATESAAVVEVATEAANAAVTPTVMGLTAVYALALELSNADRRALVAMINETLADADASEAASEAAIAA